MSLESVGSGMQPSRYASLVDDFRRWATANAEVRAAMVVGSQARTAVPADEWSDLDLVLFVSDPAKFIDLGDWARELGTVVLSTVEPTAVAGSRERRVLYSDGRDVDFSVFPVVAAATLPLVPEALGVLERGYKVVLDKDGLLSRLPELVTDQGHYRVEEPSAGEFRRCVEEFWYHLLWAARKLRRGEVWAAKMSCDGELKWYLLRVIEWATIAERGREVDVWHRGRFLDRWMQPFVRQHLPATFARYDAGDIARALSETAALFSDQARRVARLNNFPCVDDTEKAVEDLVHRTLDGSGL
jgi:aminoglycoside 6-adenylyltransferase